MKRFLLMIVLCLCTTYLLESCMMEECFGFVANARVYCTFPPDMSLTNTYGLTPMGIEDPEIKEYVAGTINDRVTEDMRKEEGESLLKRGQAMIFLFEGAGNSGDVNVRDYAYCIVVRNSQKNVPAVVYENADCTTIPDDPFNTTENPYGCAIVQDGEYPVMTYNHGSSGALRLLPENEVSVVRFSAVDTGVVTTTGGIDLHHRRTVIPSQIHPWSAGCLLIGDTYGEHYEFMLSVLGKEAIDPVTPKSSYPIFRDEAKRDEVGLVILDRTLAKEYLAALYGEQGVQLILGMENTECESDENEE